MKIAVITDPQCKPRIKFDYMRRMGQYIAAKHPDIIVHLGDHADMPSLNKYDKRGSKSFEGRRYKKDIKASHAGMDALMGPIMSEMQTGWTPEQYLFMGNHEERINRAIEDDPVQLEGLISTDDLDYKSWGWKVIPFLKVRVLKGVAFSHYLTSGPKGLPITTAAALLSKRHMSAVVGHQQGRQIAYAVRADGKSITGIIAGSSYPHNEKFMGPQGNKHWRGMLFMHQVKDGQFDEMWLSASYLKQRYP